MRLEAQALAFGYPERPVGRNVTLAVEPGEILCLLGPNGCGKTTLFKTVLGLLRPQGGTVRLDGADLTGLKRPEIARRIAYVPQAQGTAFPYTVLDVVLMGRVAHRGLFAGPTKQDRNIARQALSELGIDDLASREVTRLSGGQRQLVVVARAIAQAAPLIVMDEPTASLDFGNQVVVLSEVKRLAGRGTGIVLSTHDPDHAFAVATRVILMRDGETIAEGPPDRVLTADRLKTVYGVDVSIERLAGGQTVCAPFYGSLTVHP
ncbi:MAG: ABC transporter ATP-binding protein [Hyphomicrobiaceae bacterium]